MHLFVGHWHCTGGYSFTGVKLDQHMTWDFHCMLFLSLFWWYCHYKCDC